MKTYKALATEKEKDTSSSSPPKYERIFKTLRESKKNLRDNESHLQEVKDAITAREEHLDEINTLGYQEEVARMLAIYQGPGSNLCGGPGISKSLGRNQTSSLSASHPVPPTQAWRYLRRCNLIARQSLKVFMEPSRWSERPFNRS